MWAWAETVRPSVSGDVFDAFEAVFAVVVDCVPSSGSVEGPDSEVVWWAKVTEVMINYDAKVTEHRTKEWTVVWLVSVVALEPAYPVSILEDANNSVHLSTSEDVWW